jgi:outer membrane receptor for ferrienterochelin and colicin
MRSNGSIRSVLPTAVALVSAATAAQAQTTNDAASARPPESTHVHPVLDVVEEIVVTGTRLAAGARVPTPVTTVSAEQLAQVSPNDIATALAQAPALSDTILGSQAGSVSGAAGTNGQSLLNLRGLGVNRTLVLLDGQRLGTTNAQGIQASTANDAPRRGRSWPGSPRRGGHGSGRRRVRVAAHSEYGQRSNGS